MPTPRYACASLFESHIFSICVTVAFSIIFLALSLVYVVTAVPSVTSVGRIRVHVLVYG
nr:MAG TPA: hypothetical protein [Caudoviricetes sp.]